MWRWYAHLPCYDVRPLFSGQSDGMGQVAPDRRRRVLAQVPRDGFVCDAVRPLSHDRTVRVVDEDRRVEDAEALDLTLPSAPKPRGLPPFQARARIWTPPVIFSMFWISM